MHIIVCLDEERGMWFFDRRQSRDRVVTEDILRAVGDRTLRAAPCSADLFPSATTGEQFLEEAADEDVCFVEDRVVSPYLDRIQSLTLYHWNRLYPATVRWDVDPTAVGFRLVSVEELVGFSHEKITREVFER